MSSQSSNVKSSDIENQITSTDPKVVIACLAYAKDLVTSEQERSQSIANKSTNVLGFAGIIAALSTELITLVSSTSHKNHCLSILLSLMYAAMLASIFVVVYFAFGGRSRETRSVPSIDDIVGFQNLPEIELNRKWLVNLIVSYKNTAADVNRRVTNLYTAQQALAVAIFLLVLLGVLGMIAKVFW